MRLVLEGVFHFVGIDVNHYPLWVKPRRRGRGRSEIEKWDWAHVSNCQSFFFNALRYKFYFIIFSVPLTSWGTFFLVVFYIIYLLFIIAISCSATYRCCITNNTQWFILSTEPDLWLTNDAIWPNFKKLCVLQSGQSDRVLQQIHNLLPESQVLQLHDGENRGGCAHHHTGTAFSGTRSCGTGME